MSNQESNYDYQEELTLRPPGLNSESSGPLSEPSAHHGSSLDSNMKSIAEYQLVEEIARGGMGVVYKARNTRLDRTVALKMILAGEFASAEDVQRFHIEAQAAARLDHPNIVPIYEVDQANGRHFFAMKFIGGGSLASRIEEFRSDPRKAVQLLVKVAMAIEHAHRRGILHRDLKPANILIDNDGEPYVADLGLARSVEAESDVTKTGAIVGTPSYMPPEQAAGSKDISTAADVYSLGAILYEILTGRPPFRGSSPLETLLKVLSDAPEPPSRSNAKVDRGLELVCLKCLQKEPNERYPSASDLASELEHWLAGEPISVKPPSTIEHFRMWSRQNFGSAYWIPIIGFLIGVCVGNTLWTTLSRDDLQRADLAYASLPSEDKPLFLTWRIVPTFGLHENILIVLGLFASMVLIANMGFLVASIVRTKNQDADIVSGLLVGLIAGLCLYASIGSVLQRIMPSQRNDIKLILEQAQDYADNDLQSNRIANTYPDLENSTPSDRVDVVSRKISADAILTTPIVTWLALFSFLGVTIPIGVIQTTIAGNWIRVSRSKWYAYFKYLEASIPFGCLMMSLFMAICAYWIFGYRVPLSWSRYVLLLLSLGFVLVAVRRQWSPWVRWPIQIIWLPVFAFWALDSLPYLPSLASKVVALQRVEAYYRKNPNNEQRRINLQLGYRQYAMALANVGKLHQAMRQFQLGDAILQNSSPREKEELEISRWYQAWVSDQLGDRERSIALRTFTLASLKDRNYVSQLDLIRAKILFSTYLRKNEIDKCLGWIETRQLRSPEEWWVYWQLALELRHAIREAKLDRPDLNLATILDRKLLTSDELDDGLKARVRGWASNEQTWQISKVFPQSFTPEYLTKPLPADRSALVQILESGPTKS